MSSKPPAEAKKQTWEQAAGGAWSALEEDEHGRLKQQGTLADQHAKRQRRRDDAASGVARGLIRYVVVVVDASLASGEKDMRPSRLAAVKSLVATFVADFFATNALSSLSIIATRDAQAYVVSNLTSSERVTSEALQKSKHLMTSKGDASLVNALGLALELLAPTPDYGFREILLISSALTTRDAGDVHATIEQLQGHRITASVVALAAETHVCKTIAKFTGGTFTVALDRSHLGDLLALHVQPPRLAADDARKARPKPQLIEMGFPKLKTDAVVSLSFGDGGVPTWARTAYVCPRCHARATALPTECCVCELALVSSPHLAASYHHLFPAPHYKPSAETDVKKEAWIQRCFGCNDVFQLDAATEPRYTCTKCQNTFCAGCDEFVHVSLHNCPGCLG
ncbi:Ssl1-like-domain-containing protein [Pelagophyceae sp. CCMP2097]|nr:Ssl1-like-domain-containing protein [Pelagophyceae sp. CCMP2097]